MPCERHAHELLKQSAQLSARPWQPSMPKNAPIISRTQAMLDQIKFHPALKSAPDEGDLPLCARFSWLGAGLLAGERPAESLLEPTYKGRRAERPARAFMGANGFTLGLGERFSQESAPIVSTIEQGFRPYNAVIAAGKMRARARPWPIARTLGDFAQNRRPF